MTTRPKPSIKKLTMKILIGGHTYSANITQQWDHFLVTLHRGRRSLLLGDEQRVEWDTPGQAIAWILERVRQNADNLDTDDAPLDAPAKQEG